MASWADTPLVFVTRPTCPECSGLEYDKVRTESNGDGTSTRKVICRDCGQRYKIVEELPELGNVILPSEIMYP